MMDDDGDKQLEILDDLKDILEHNFADHFQFLLPIILTLMKSNIKEESSVLN